MENPTKMDDLGLPLFSETSIWIWIGLGENLEDTVEIHIGESVNHYEAGVDP